MKLRFIGKRSGKQMNYLEYIIYHNTKNGRKIVRHKKRFFTSYEEARTNATNL